jgi:hypothetical protein
LEACHLAPRLGHSLLEVKKSKTLFGPRTKTILSLATTRSNCLPSSTALQIRDHNDHKSDVSNSCCARGVAFVGLFGSGAMLWGLKSSKSGERDLCGGLVGQVIRSLLHHDHNWRKQKKELVMGDFLFFFTFFVHNGSQPAKPTSKANQQSQPKAPELAFFISTNFGNSSSDYDKRWTIAHFYFLPICPAL